MSSTPLLPSNLPSNSNPLLSSNPSVVLYPLTVLYPSAALYPLLSCTPLLSSTLPRQGAAQASGHGVLVGLTAAVVAWLYLAASAYFLPVPKVA